MSSTERIAIVTGAGQGIGRAIAKALASAGNVVLIADLNEKAAAAVEAEIVGEGGKAHTIRTDVTDVTSIRALFEGSFRRFGRIDVLVNNAGILHSTPLEDITPEEWDRVLSVNLRGTFSHARAPCPS